jgi:hypothetical protein
MEPVRPKMNDRAEPRDEVYHRARMTLDDRRIVPVTVVNLSPRGFMARTEVEVGVGETVSVTLPVVGTVAAAVRWALGGRIGCRLERAIEPRAYHALLTAAGG